MNFVIQWPKKLQVAKFFAIVLFNYLFMAAKENEFEKVSTIIVVVHNIKWNINALFLNRQLRIYFIFYKYLLKSCQICNINRQSYEWVIFIYFLFEIIFSKMEVTQQLFHRAGNKISTITFQLFFAMHFFLICEYFLVRGRIFCDSQIVYFALTRYIILYLITTS